MSATTENTTTADLAFALAVNGHLLEAAVADKRTAAAEAARAGHRDVAALLAAQADGLDLIYRTAADLTRS